MKVVKYYEHNFNRPIMKNGVKMVKGDIMKVYEDGSIELNGKMIEEETTEALEEEEETEGIKSLEEMDKDELEKYASDNFSVDLDKRKSIETLIEEINELMGVV